MALDWPESRADAQGSKRGMGEKEELGRGGKMRAERRLMDERGWWKEAGVG